MVVDPLLSNADNRASRDRGRWIPIRPGTDGALMMGMMRWMIENRRVNHHLPRQPEPQGGRGSRRALIHQCLLASRQRAGPSARGRFVRGSDLGMAIAPELRYKDDDPYFVMGADGQPLQADLASGTAPLELIDASIELDGRPVAVQTAYMQLKANAMRMEIAQYAADCGVPADTIVALADKFTSHGRRAAITGHGGMMSGSGFYNAFGVVALNLLIGNVNWKGGLAINGGTFRHDGDGPRYRLASFEGQIKPGASRSGATCLTRRPASSHSRKPPANPSCPGTWFPNAPGLTTQWLTGAMEGYPYRLKALIMWSVNPMYGIPGLRAQLGEDFADPRKLPLIVSVDPLINESNAYADYIVPDSMLYESWGWTAPWNGVPTRMTTARWPVIEPRMDKTADGQRIGIRPS